MADQLAYLDNAATTPMDPRVREAMMPYLGPCFGNPSSLHNPGRRARAAVDQARKEVADLLEARPTEVTFTASGTEANNLAILGVMMREDRSPGHLVVSAMEHPSVLETCRFLERRRVPVTYLPVGMEGIVEPDVLAESLRSDTRLVSVMAANNVVGTLQPITQLAGLARSCGALFHTDAVQAAGKIPLRMASMGVDLLSISAHKLHGPQGVGALCVSTGVRLTPIVHGGGQEGGLRSATENVAGIVGLGRAAAIARETMTPEAVRLVAMRDRIIDSVLGSTKNAYLVGDRYRRLPGHVCLGLSGQEGEAIRLLLALDEVGIAVSSGSACSAHHRGEPSHVLRAMGFDPVAAQGALRITLGRFTTDQEVDHLLEALPGIAAALRRLTSDPST